MSACICEFGDECFGSGVIHCDGCGGDSCVCAACFGNGEISCDGCDYCDYCDGADCDYEESA